MRGARTGQCRRPLGQPGRLSHAPGDQRACDGARAGNAHPAEGADLAGRVLRGKPARWPRGIRDVVERRIRWWAPPRSRTAAIPARSRRRRSRSITCRVSHTTTSRSCAIPCAHPLIGSFAGLRVLPSGNGPRLQPLARNAAGDRSAHRSAGVVDLRRQTDHLARRCSARASADFALAPAAAGARQDRSDHVASALVLRSLQRRETPGDVAHGIIPVSGAPR